MAVNLAYITPVSRCRIYCMYLICSVLCKLYVLSFDCLHIGEVLLLKRLYQRG